MAMAFFVTYIYIYIYSSRQMIVTILSGARGAADPSTLSARPYQDRGECAQPAVK